MNPFVFLILLCTAAIAEESTPEVVPHGSIPAPYVSAKPQTRPAAPTVVKPVSLATVKDGEFENYGFSLTTKEVPRYNGAQNKKWGPEFTEIYNHRPPNDESPGETLMDMGHEIVHGISNAAREKSGLWKGSSGSISAFYLGKGKAVYLKKRGNIKKSSVERFIPAFLRRKRFNTYVKGQRGFEDDPHYLYDEFNAYIHGARIGGDQYRQRLWNPKGESYDFLQGSTEFIGYALAMAKSTKHSDPDYFEGKKNEKWETSVKDLTGYLVTKAMDTYWQNKDIPPYSSYPQEKYLKQLIQSDLGKFAKETYGEEWFNRTFNLQRESPFRHVADDTAK